MTFDNVISNTPTIHSSFKTPAIFRGYTTKVALQNTGCPKFLCKKRTLFNTY